MRLKLRDLILNFLFNSYDRVSYFEIGRGEKY